MQSGSVTARDDPGARPAEELIPDGEIRRKHLPGVRGLHKGEGVWTVGRPHPGPAGERLPKQRPNVNEGLPASESHTVKMRMAPVFDALPASPDVHKQRRIAAAPPFLDRAVCDGAVITFLGRCPRSGRSFL